MHSLIRLFKETKSSHRFFVLAIICVAVETMFEVIIPYLMADIIDVGIVNKDVSVFYRVGIEMAICALLSLLFGWLYARFASKATSLFGATLRHKQFETIQRYSFTNLDHFETSGLITRLSSDVMVIQNSITSGLRPFVRGPVMLIFGLFMACLISVQLAMVFLIVLPILAGILLFIIYKVSPMYSKLQKAMDALNRQIQENLIAIRVVKSFVRDTYEEEKFEEVNEALSRTCQETFHYALFNTPAFQMTMYMAIVLLMYFGIGMIQSNQMMVGELTGILSYVLQIMNSLMMISNVFLMMVRSLASCKRIEDVFDETNDMLDTGTVQHVDEGSISFSHVNFKYSQDAQEYVLKDLNFEIASGERIGILGATGSAKSSLVSLMCRLYDINEGSIKIGSVPIKDYSIKALRDSISMVLQQNVLFTGTVAQNLRWGNEKATDQELVEVCKMACADEFVQTMPKGYDTMIEQSGTNVSGGQRQRLCLARALLSRPKILILDDSTSALDTKTEAKIQKALESYGSITQIIIAQRISSIQHCDRVMILEEGKIVDFDTPDVLMHTSKIYQELVASQNQGVKE